MSKKKENRALKAQIVKVYGNQAKFAKVIGAQESKVSRVCNNLIQLMDSEKAEWAKRLECGVEIFA